MASTSPVLKDEVEVEESDDKDVLRTGAADETQGKEKSLDEIIDAYSG